MSRQASITHIQVVTAEIERRIKRAGVSVSYAENIPTAYATENSVVLPQLQYPVSREELDYHRYKAIHEAGHHLRPAVFPLMKAASKCGLTNEGHYIWNLLEDEVQETEQAEKYYGDRLTLSRGREIHVSRMLDTFQTDKPPVDETGVKFMGAYILALRSRDWHYEVDKLTEVVSTVLPRESTELADTLEGEGWIERIQAGGTEREVYDLSRDLYIRLFPDQPEPPTAEEMEQQAQQNEKGEGEEDQEVTGNQGSEVQQNGDEDEGEPAPGDVTISWEDLLASDHKEMGGTDDTRGGEVHITYDSWKVTEGGVFYPLDHIKESEPDGRYSAESPSMDNTIANQLRRHIQSLSRSTWETERYSGRINKRALKRIVMGTEDRHRRVFQRRTDAKDLDTAITVLVDCSGSMSGSQRYEHANTAAGTLVECFDKVLRVPVEVIGHTTDFCGDETVKVYPVKPFGKVVPGGEVYSKLCAVCRCGNADGDAILYAARRLAKRKESRKILVLLADGQPTDTYAGGDGHSYGDPAKMMKLAIKETEHMGIEMYGIGIGYNQMGEFFKDCETIQDGGDITGPLLRAAEKFVTRGR